MEYKKAIAFVDAMIGWEDVAQEQSKPKSPHCITHLQAILGVGSLNNVITYTPEPSGNLKKIEAIADYLIDVGSSIKLALKEKPL
jgi:hypothetical protein